MTTYEGGCHCGAVRVRVEKAEPVAALIDCNCTVCTKKGILHLGVEPSELTIVSGDDALETYRFHTKVAEHRFCRTCGIHVISKPRNNPNRFSVNARCLDDFAALAGQVEIVPFDGENHPKDNVA